MVTTLQELDNALLGTNITPSVKFTLEQTVCFKDAMRRDCHIKAQIPRRKTLCSVITILEQLDNAYSTLFCAYFKLEMAWMCVYALETFRYSASLPP